MKRITAILISLGFATGALSPVWAEAPTAPVPMNETPECAALREQEFIRWEQNFRTYAESTGATEMIAIIDAQIAAGVGVRERVLALMGPVSPYYSYPFYPSEPPRRCNASDRDGRIAEWRAFERIQCQYISCQPTRSTTVEVDACGAVWVTDTARPGSVSKFCD